MNIVLIHILFVILFSFLLYLLFFYFIKKMIKLWNIKNLKINILLNTK